MNPFPIVGVGASAGGLDALTRLIRALPEKSGLALVIVQHLDPHHESQLSRILAAQTTSLEVVDAAHGMQVEPDRAYVMQPNTNVAIADGVLSVTPRPDDRRPHYPIDHFLRSLAAVQGARAVGVVLSGTGSDGTIGLSEIKAAGGVTFAQDEQTAQHGGMPQSAIASGAVDLVLPPEDIAARLMALPAHPYLRADEETGHPEEANAKAFQRVIETLRHTSGVDFSQYRDTTLKRRTARRMLLRGFRTPAEYVQFLERDGAEAEALYRDVLINVTSFFREPEMFEELKDRVFPEILKGQRSEPIRVWVPGCSSGQEAYSIAIALLEFVAAANVRRDIQIFATDLGDPAVLERARAGLYPESIESEVSPDRLRRFFTKEDRSYRIEKSVRDLCVFARQNIAVDPPFSKVDLVSCRNVLIYMSTALQERLIPVFHFALNPRGFLVLGVAETVGTSADLFEQASRAHKIYRRLDGGRRPQLTFMADEWLAGVAVRPAGPGRRPPDFEREADRVALARYAPPSVLVNADFNVLQFRGRTAPFLEAPAGQPTADVMRMAREGLFMELRSALVEAKASRLPVVREGLRVSDGGRDLEFAIRVLPVTAGQSADLCLLVLFETSDWPVFSPPVALTDLLPADRDIAWLRQELVSSKQYLQSTLDAHEAANQELRAAHEEVLSSNEELQSTNEELETAKEELQSTNEELTTVNEQFQKRNRDLDVLADDLSNFIASADVPMITVGRDLAIRRVTSAAQRAFNVLPADVGRPITNIKFALQFDDVGEVIESVVASVQPWEREIVDRAGRWWLLRVRPFQTSDNRIDGATLVAVDIDSIKRSRELIESRDYALAVVQTVREPLVVLDPDCRIGLANEAFLRLFGENAERVVGQLLWETGGGVWNEPSLRRLLRSACEGRQSVVNVEVQCMVPARGLRILVLNARAITRAARPELVLVSIDDVTEIRQAERLRIDAETLRLVDRRKDEFLGILAHELRNPLAPMRFALDAMRLAEGNPADTVRARQVLERQTAHMVRIVDDLLDVSRITQGKVELRRELLRLQDIVHAAVELSRPAADAARHVLTVSLPDEPVIVNGDAVRLTQVLVNLLNNAIKFTPEAGHIWLIAEIVEHPEPPDQVRIRVRDTGIGIPPEMLDTIFDMFMQGDRSLERARGGLGVGLTLVRNLVALHGGTVNAASEGRDRGSEFSVLLPVDAATPRAAGPNERLVEAATQRALRILVADDNEDGRRLLSLLLTGYGHTVITANDGHQALAVAAEFHPDVAILDIGMPGLNGYEVATRLRALDPGSRPFLIALSGWGQAEDKEHAVDAGFDQHFTKPADLNALLKVIGERFR